MQSSELEPVIFVTPTTLHVAMSLKCGSLQISRNDNRTNKYVHEHVKRRSNFGILVVMHLEIFIFSFHTKMPIE
jgi:hypothetical protein